MKKFLKRNRYTVILLVIFVLFVILGLKVKDIFVPDEGKPTYGDRLKNLDKYPISDEVYQKIEEALTKGGKIYYTPYFDGYKEKKKLNNFPIIGMKHPESKSVSWTKDREIVTESEKDEE